MERGSKLPGPVVERLHEALLAAFPAWATLAQMVRVGLDENLYALVGPGNLASAVFELIQWAEAHGRIDDLLEASRIANPGNGLLRAFVEERREVKRDRDPMALALEPGAEAQVTHNLPLRRLFIGRKEALSVLHNKLQQKRRATLFALSGTGKTALVLEYAHRAVDLGLYPGGVWWVHADGSPIDVMTRLASALRACAPALLGHVREEAPAGELAEAARVVLQGQRSPSLLVLDDVSELGLEGLLPGGAVRVLGTVRERSWAVGERIKLDPLADGDALALAETIAGPLAGDVEARACEQLVGGQLGGLAAAVEVAARAVKSWAGSWVTYQKHLNQHLSEALDDAHDRSQHYPRGVLAALDLSLDRFSPPGSPERALLVGAASFAPDMVPYIWVGEVGKICAGEIKSMRALATAEGLGLLEVDRDAQTLMMHRLVHRRVRERFVEHQWRMLPCVESWLTKMVGRERAQTEEIDARRAHVEEALKVAEQEEGFELPWIRIAEGLARHLRYRGRYDESLSLFTRAVEKARSRSDLFAEKFRCLSGLALTLQAIGRAEEAAPLLEEALNLLQTAYAPEHPDIAVGLATLARVLPDVGDVGRARSLLEEALAIAEKIRGPDHPDVAKLLSNLAGLLLYTGDVDRALPQLRRALATLERTQGPDEPDVTTIRSTLAMALRDAGRADEALPLAERVLAVDERTYGPFHPEVARSLSKLAGVLRDLKRPGEARPLLERALEIDERTHGPRHANVVKDLERLLGVLRDLEDEGSAKPLLDRLRDLDQGLSSGMPTGEHTRVTAVTVSVSELPCAPRR